MPSTTTVYFIFDAVTGVFIRESGTRRSSTAPLKPLEETRLIWWEIKNMIVMVTNASPKIHSGPARGTGRKEKAIARG